MNEKSLLEIHMKKYEGEIISQKVGFVTYIMGENFEFLVNGTEVKLKGVVFYDK